MITRENKVRKREGELRTKKRERKRMIKGKMKMIQILLQGEKDKSKQNEANDILHMHTKYTISTHLHFNKQPKNVSLKFNQTHYLTLLKLYG